MSLRVTTLFTAVLLSSGAAIAQDSQDGQGAYRSPAFTPSQESGHVPVSGTSEYTFNPDTGLYVHTPQGGGSQQAAPQENNAWRGNVGADPVDQQSQQADIEAESYDPTGSSRRGNPRGERNIYRGESYEDKGSNRDAYQEMMTGVENSGRDLSADDTEGRIDRSYLHRTQRTADEEEYYDDDDDRGAFTRRSSANSRDRYNERDRYGNSNRYGNSGRYGYDDEYYGQGSRRIQAEPKTGNRDAYQELMERVR